MGHIRHFHPHDFSYVEVSHENRFPIRYIFAHIVIVCSPEISGSHDLLVQRQDSCLVIKFFSHACTLHEIVVHPQDVCWLTRNLFAQKIPCPRHLPANQVMCSLRDFYKLTEEPLVDSVFVCPPQDICRFTRYV